VKNPVAKSKSGMILTNLILSAFLKVG